MTTTTINGNTYSDDQTSSRDMLNGGHRTWWQPLLQDFVADVSGKKTSAVNEAATASTNAATAATWGGSGLVANSTSSRILQVTSNVSFTIEAGKGFVGGHEVKITDKTAPANAPRYMRGFVISYSGTSLNVNVTQSVGTSTTYNSWDIRIWRNPNERLYSPKTGAYTVAAGDRGDTIDATSGVWFLDFPTAASLGMGWFVYARNSGTGTIVVRMNGTETVDGGTTFNMYPGEYRCFMCDGVNFKSEIITPFCVTFSASGSFVKPPGYALLLVECLGAGGGGSNGIANSPSTNRYGGNGGAGGSYVKGWIRTDALAASETVTIGAGGAGAPAPVAVTNTLAAGSAGGNTVFGSNLLTAYGGAGGRDSFMGGAYGGGIGNAGFSGGPGSPQIPADGSGATFGGAGPNSGLPNYSVYGGGAGGRGVDASNGLAASSGGGSIYGGSGGGGGGGISGSNNLTNAAGAGGSWKATVGGGGAAGVVATIGGNGGAGASSGPILAGSGGGGAASGTGGQQGNGGAGGYGCGGGGGAGGTNVTVGAGGAGGSGLLRITGHT